MRASFSDTSGVTRASKPVVETVVEAVARVEDVEPLDLSEPVFTFLDPDALDALVTSVSAETDLTVAFEAWEHEIVIDSDGTVRIDDEVRAQIAFEETPPTGQRRLG